VNTVKNRISSISIFPLVLSTLLIATAYSRSDALAQATNAAGQASSAALPAANPPPSPGAAIAPTGGSQPSAPVIDPEVRAVLNGACDLLASSKTVTYHAEITFDSVLPSYVKLQYAGAMDVAVKRPDHLAANYKSDLGAKQVWYDGKTLTIFDPAHRVYASIPAADSIDAMLQQVAEEYKLTVPLENLNLNDPCKRAYRDVQRGKYVGINDVNGVACDHLGFIQTDTDWQLWVAHGKTPVVRKIVITYKKLPAEPQWAAVLSDWHFNQQLPASLFQPKIPKGVIKTSFLKVEEKHQ
jgi:hypothetical protein